MLIIGFLNSKGGVGKTTLATNIAVRAAKEYARVGLVDIDPQKGTHRWFERRQGKANPALLIGETDPDEAREKLSLTGWDVAIIDGGASVLDRTIRAAMICDLVVIPMRSSDQDIGSTNFVVTACAKQGVNYMIVINDATSKSCRRAHAVREALTTKAKQPVAKTIIVRRALLEDVMATGQAACEFDQKTHAAARQDVEDLYAEIIAAAQKAKRREAGKK